jgi:hypothetical protein
MFLCLILGYHNLGFDGALSGRRVGFVSYFYTIGIAVLTDGERIIFFLGQIRGTTTIFYPYSCPVL